MKKNSLCLIYNIASLSKMAGKMESFSGKIIWIWTCNQIPRKVSYWENLLQFRMMLNKTSAHLYTLDINIYAIKNSLTNNHLFIVNNSFTRKRCEICLKSTIKTPEWRFTVFVVYFEHISYLFRVFLLLTLNKLVFAVSLAINLKTLKLLTAASINRCAKILVKWQLICCGIKRTVTFEWLFE